MSDHRYNQHTNQQVYIDPGFDVHHRYGPLDSRCFIRETDDETLVCLLCIKKQKIISLETFELHDYSQEHQAKFDQLKYNLLDRIPKSNGVHMRTLGEYLTRLYQQQALPHPIYETRDLIITQFSVLLRSIDPEASVRVHGSHLTRTALYQSNINLEILHPNARLFKKDPRAKNSIHHKLIDNDAKIGNQYNYHTIEYDLISNPIETLNKIYVAFYTSYLSRFFQIYCEFPLKDMNKRVPKLTLRHVETGTLLELCCYDDSSYKLSELLRIYSCLDERFVQLSCLVKYWANICSINNPDSGTYPPETFMIMLIYYLQRTSPPVLPCIHELFPHLWHASNEENVNKNTQGKSTSDVDHLITNGLKNIKLNEVQSKKQIIRDNIPRDDNLISHQNNSETDEHLDPNGAAADQEVEPVDEEIEEDDDDDDHRPYFHIDLKEIRDLIQTWKSNNQSTIETLFIGFMLFMRNEFEVNNSAISIRSTRNFIPHSSKNTQFKTKMIEDPIKPKLNISRCIGSMRQYEYIVNCFKRAFYYLTSIPLDSDLRSVEINQKNPKYFIKLFYNENRLMSYFNMKWFSNGQLIKPPRKDTIQEMINQQLFARDVDVIKSLFRRANNDPKAIVGLPRFIANAYQKKFLIPQDSAAVRFCWLCKSTGHVRRDCFNIKMTTLHNELQNYDTNLDANADLDQIFIEMYRRDLISPEVSSKHDRIASTIHDIIQKGLPNFKFDLERFGSTVNNLGSVDSDIDICLTLKGNSTGIGVDCVEILRQVSEVLDRKGVDRLEPVLSARVPIIRFKFEGYDIDLSMYNHCAIYNSELLRFYSTIDYRVPILAYLVKKIAKICCIADASRGSLSSYAWSLLVIHYLQKVEPPVLPVLQELTSDDKQSENKFGVQGWNVWFRKDVTDFPNNCRLTITELFKGFFIYYSCFNWDAHVVTIRKSINIPRYKKSWNNSLIAIEDPFELTYNLASRLDDAMSMYIINTLANAYRHIVKTQRIYIDTRKRMPNQDLSALLFSTIRLINGSYPPYRGCRICHRIGHRIKDCPDNDRRKPPLPNRRGGNRPVNNNNNQNKPAMRS